MMKRRRRMVVEVVVVSTPWLAVILMTVPSALFHWLLSTAL